MALRADSTLNMQRTQEAVSGNWSGSHEMRHDACPTVSGYRQACRAVGDPIERVVGEARDRVVPQLGSSGIGLAEDRTESFRRN